MDTFINIVGAVVALIFLAGGTLLFLACILWLITKIFKSAGIEVKPKKSEPEPDAEPWLPPSRIPLSERNISTEELDRRWPYMSDDAQAHMRREGYVPQEERARVMKKAVDEMRGEN